MMALAQRVGLEHYSVGYNGLWVQFPVLGALKSVAIIGFVLWLFPAEVRPAPVATEIAPLTPEQRRTISCTGSNPAGSRWPRASPAFCRAWA